ncbi:ACT domain-containing protein [Fusibacter sp. JL216-2]|uniref:ACT domain-containing protein n=1 Tax=Fusibacter sp. JL216-2 TaxID=3071453 RepID=UPI003D333763
MKAILTVIGRDQVGIIAGISQLLAGHDINIEDVNQTIMGGNFTMMMLVDVSQSNVSFEQVKGEMTDLGETLSLSVRLQREDIFNCMHQV